MWHYLRLQNIEISNHKNYYLFIMYSVAQMVGVLECEASVQSTDLAKVIDVSNVDRHHAR